MQAHETEIVLLISFSDGAIIEVFTNSDQIARQLKVRGRLQLRGASDESGLRCEIFQRLQHFFIVPAEDFIVSGLAAIASDLKAKSSKLASMRLEMERQAQAQAREEHTDYERNRLQNLPPEKKAELAQQRGERQKQWGPEQRRMATRRAARWVGNMTEERRAEYRSRRTETERNRRANWSEEQREAHRARKRQLHAERRATSAQSDAT